MHFANHDNRLVLVDQKPGAPLEGAAAIDVQRASDGRLPSAPDAAYERWDEVRDWAIAARDQAPADARVTIELARLGSPSPRPRQMLGVGLNYADHGAESGMELPPMPLVFTKLATAITGPYGTIEISTKTVDWEVEIALVIGRRARHVDAADAWTHIAGVTVAQDLSDRDIQWRPPDYPQFGLGKSLPGFAPLGPVLVTPDGLPDRENLELSCRLNGERVQHAHSADMLFDVGELIAYLSGILPLLPGDVILTGTPSGVGMGRTPPLYLNHGDQLESTVEGIGTMRHQFASVEALNQAVPR